MLRILAKITVLTALAAGCGGDGGSGETGDNGNGANPNRDLCEDIPYFELQGANCGLLENSFDAVMSAARECNTSDDCQVVAGQCERLTTAECWYAVNMCDTPVPPYPDGTPSRGWVDPNRWATLYISGNCKKPTTSCAGFCGPIPDVECVEGRCTLLY